MRGLLLFSLGVVLGGGAAFFGPDFLDSHGVQPYAGQDTRQISSLSPEDILELEAGNGWGLAKPAEFNGYPGPLHVIELASELELSPEQLDAVQSSRTLMSERARALGADLIAAEAALDEGFRTGDFDRTDLIARLEAAETARTNLRAVHLQAHLEITPLLTETQREQYAQLRGYGADDHSNGHAGH